MVRAMMISGCDCSIVIKTTHREMDVPYSEETLREAVSLLVEEAAIEGSGACKAIRKNCGVTGCVADCVNTYDPFHIYTEEAIFRAFC